MTESQFIIPNQEEREVSIKELVLKIRDWFNFFLSKWLIVLIFALIGSLLGYIYAYRKKTIYTATTTFVLETGDPSSGLGQYSGLASMVGIDLGSGGGLFQSDNILELYKSRTMIEKTLLSPLEGSKDKLLIDRYILVNKLWDTWVESPDLRKIRFNNDLQGYDKRLRDSIVGTIVADINKNYLTLTKIDKKSNIIKVDVEAKDEYFAKTFNDELVKNVNDFYVQTKTKKSLENVLILQQKVDSVRNVMNGAIYSVATVVDATPNLNPTRQILRAGAQRSQFNVEANKAILTQLVQNLELSKISLHKETPLIQVIDNPLYPLAKKKPSKLISIVIGGVLFGFIIVVLLFLKRLYIIYTK